MSWVLCVWLPLLLDPKPSALPVYRDARCILEEGGVNELIILLLSMCHTSLVAQWTPRDRILESSICCGAVIHWGATVTQGVLPKWWQSHLVFS